MKMRALLVVLLGFLVVSFASIVAFYFGRIAGYNERAVFEAATEGTATIVTLRAIREGKTDEATQLLETSVDSYLTEYYARDVSGFPVSLLGPKETEASLIRHVAAYRREYSSPSPLPEVRAFVDSAAQKYR